MLGVTRAYIDCMDKITAIREYMAGQGLDPANVIYMGDDIPDLSACAKWASRSARPTPQPK